jgi:hypothetical protein
MSWPESSVRRTTAIGVVVPVHNEELLLGKSLTALGAAFAQVAMQAAVCRTAIVLDACHDRSALVARQWMRRLGSKGGTHQAMLVRCNGANVGMARRAGCDALLREWSAIDPRNIWLATTDADSEVPRDWLSVQLARHEEGFDIWTGRVTVLDWSSHTANTAQRWQEQYRGESAPIHGTNFGLNGGIYLEAGGFPTLCTGEDRALYQAALARGAVAHHDRSAPVTTSGRREARAPLGFAHALTVI